MSSMNGSDALGWHGGPPQDTSTKAENGPKKRKPHPRGGRRHRKGRAVGAGVEEKAWEGDRSGIDHQSSQGEAFYDSSLEAQSMSDEFEYLGVSDASAHHPEASGGPVAVPKNVHHRAAMKPSTTGPTNPVDLGTGSSQEQNGGASKPGRTADHWPDQAQGDTWKRVRATDTSTTLAISDSKQRISEWVHAQTAQAYRNMSSVLRNRAIDHIHNFKHPAPDPAEWNTQLRLMIWRAVVRANFFWKNPYTNHEEGRPKPIVRPTGPYENHFDAFVECAAERLDRIGRDLPDPDFVKQVETEVRMFISSLEAVGATRQLQYLAFLLLFDEEQRKSSLSLSDMQERIRRAVGPGDLDWRRMEFMKRGNAPPKPVQTQATVVMADLIWKDVVTKL